MELLLAYAFSWLGVPYKWGGSGRDGIDCSGLVQELLKSVGIAPPVDSNCQALFEYYSTRGQQIPLPKAGALVFYGKDRMTHIALAIDDTRIVEAGGGDSKVNTRADAIARNAWVRVRTFDHRSDVSAIIMPNYPSKIT